MTVAPAFRAVFFLSGAAGLLFETLWFRQAALLLGSSVLASSLVLASFMTGLALGNILAARYGSRLQRPILAFALLEAAIGATGCALVFLLPALTPFLASVFGQLLGQPLALNSLRFASAFSLILVPATAMGATLPVWVRGLSASGLVFGQLLGRLYGWNTLGAVAGAVIGEALLIERLGVSGTAIVGALTNGAAAGLALLLGRHWPAASAAADGPASGVSARARRLLCAAFLSGATLLALEVVWFRFLQLFMLGTTLVFALLLAVVLLGIAAGGLLASFWLGREPQATRFLAPLALCSGLAAATTYFVSADVFARLGNRILYETPEILRVAAALMLPACVGSGLLFTLLGAALEEELREETRTTGMLTVANTLGAAAGALLGGLVLLPSLGIEVSIAVLAASYSGVALFSLRREPGPPQQARSAYATLGLAAAAYAACLLLFPFGLMRRHYMRLAAGRWSSDGSRVVAAREGRTETIVYLRKELLAQPVHHRLLTNSVSMSGTTFQGRRYMSLFAWWPLALHPEPKRALLISFGVGATARALTLDRGLEAIDVVDTSRDILELSRIVFAPGEPYPLDDPRVRTHVEDGRFFLLTTRNRYDVITGEPPPLKAAGVASLYSREYFQLMKGCLAPGGIATYWLPAAQLEPVEMLSLIGGFCEAFPDCSLWSGLGPEWMLVGANGWRGPASEQVLGRLWREPRVAAALRDLGFEGPEQLAATFIGDARFLRELVGATPPLSDDHPLRLSYRPPRDNLSFIRPLTNPAATAQRFFASGVAQAQFPATLHARIASAFAAQQVVDRYAWSEYTGARPGVADLSALLTQSRLRAAVLWLMESSDVEERIAARLPNQDSVLEAHRGAAAMADRDYRRAAAHLGRVQAKDAARAGLHRVLALALAGQVDEARAALERSRPERRASDTEDWAWLEAALAEATPGR